MIKLFCLPFAGGSKYSYRGYETDAPADIEVIPIELPGRGQRIREPLMTDLEALVDDLYDKLAPQLDLGPYAIYGHSMGAFLTHLLTKKILANNHEKPLHLFLTGCRGPSVDDPDKGKHLLPKDKFVDKLIEYGGSPDEILQDRQLFDFFEPILRADFEAIESYKHDSSEPHNIPMTVMIGDQEVTTADDARAWQKESTIPINFIEFPGKHFFIFDHQKEIMEIITSTLTLIQITS
ncbi:thioesterase [Fulvivirga sp. 29W222]|uniref:Thioesterase n=1 Tax=Fulvivirga marina TaxID=2494733 RepID=A0A937KGF7_9BACT|nr:thioesterase [Fulvivirga marina]MBL6449148.1 thioesterase [Fulvivirga marina]